MIPFTPTVVTGILSLVSLILTMVFGKIMGKGKVYFKLHRIFSIVTFIIVIVHTYLAVSRYF